MLTVVGLWCVAALLTVAVMAIAVGRASFGSALVYGASLAASLVALAGALAHLVAGDAATSVALPVGLPGIGAQFRLDALAAFFLVVANLGGATASLYGLGYGRPSEACWRAQKDATMLSRRAGDGCYAHATRNHPITIQDDRTP